MSVDLLIKWIAAREALRVKKESGAPPPWTDDLILQKYRFCNVRRTDDRVSRWLRKNVLTEDNLKQCGLASFLMFTAFCRWNNWPPVLAEIMRRGFYPANSIDWMGVIKVVNEFQERGEKSFTGAYMIRSSSEAGASKIEFVVNQVVCVGIGAVIPQLEAALNSGCRRNVWAALTSRLNWGSFMSGQVVDDWGWTPLLNTANDTNLWAPQGPGSLRGFNRVKGLPLNTRHKEDEWCETLQAWRAQMIEELGDKFSDVDLMSCQNVCCEYDKWCRVKNGEGKPRSNYRPETAYEV